MEYRKWDANACKSLSILVLTVEDRYLDKIKDAKTLKEGADILAECFTKTNDAKLKKPQYELMILT